MTPTVPDGPDTELAAAVNFLARNEGLLIEMEHSPAGRAAATIVRAVLARPAAGRDLTAQDVGVALDGVTHLSWQIRDEVARELNGIARPAVARTDGQPPADPQSHSRDVVEVPRGRLTEWYELLRKAVDATVSPLAGDLSAASGEVAYWGQQPAAPADDTAAPEDRITAVRELLNAICDPMDQAEAESHLDILGVTRAEVDEAKRRTAARPVRDSPTPTSGEEPTDA